MAVDRRTRPSTRRLPGPTLRRDAARPLRRIRPLPPIDLAFTAAGGGPRGGGPAVRLATTVKVLLGLMLAVQLGQAFLPFRTSHALVTALGMQLFANGQFLEDRVYTLLTHAFVHGDWWHLIFNGLWIAILGSRVHEILGPGRFLAFFAVSTVIAGAVQILATWGEATFTVGASGFVYALIACIGFLYVIKPQDSRRERLKKLFAFTVAIFVLNVAFAYVAGGFVTPGGVAWQAHAGGFLAGLFLFLPFARSAVRARRGGAG
jgi:membrane associated rhomboid family serine protease